MEDWPVAMLLPTQEKAVQKKNAVICSCLERDSKQRTVFQCSETVRCQWDRLESSNTNYCSKFWCRNLKKTFLERLLLMTIIVIIK